MIAPSYDFYGKPLAREFIDSRLPRVAGLLEKLLDAEEENITISEDWLKEAERELNSFKEGMEKVGELREDSVFRYNVKNFFENFSSVMRKRSKRDGRFKSLWEISKEILTKLEKFSSSVENPLLYSVKKVGMSRWKM